MSSLGRLRGEDIRG
ncbi:hypothetical protein A2U01_0095659, partial [Trifolium medium]|nr:hypothetical protein [Trifolium medium]